MNRTGRAWYTGVIVLIIIAIVGVLIAMCAPAANALDTDKHGRYYAYAKKVWTTNPDGSPCLTYQPVRKDMRTGKVRYAAKDHRGKFIKVDKSTCASDWGRDGLRPVGYRIINMTPKGRYLTFYTLPRHSLEPPFPEAIVTVYRKDFKTDRLTAIGTTYESYYHQYAIAPGDVPITPISTP